MPFIAIALFIALALGGGATVVAEGSHPGDAMYTVKTHVNDNVRAGIATTEKDFVSIGSTIKTSLGMHADQDSNAEATTTENGEATTSAHAQGSLRVNTNTDVDAGGSATGGVNVKL